MTNEERKKALAAEYEAYLSNFPDGDETLSGRSGEEEIEYLLKMSRAAGKTEEEALDIIAQSLDEVAALFGLAPSERRLN